MENKPTAVFEITSTQIKLVIGTYKDDKVFVIFTKSKDIRGIVDKNGMIIDVRALANALSEFSLIKDNELKIKLNIKEVTLVLPALGLDVYQSEKTSFPLATSGKLDRKDFGSLVYTISNEPLPNQGEMIVDIVPQEFILDENRKFLQPPLGEVTHRVTASAMVYALNARVVSQYKNAVIGAGYKIKRIIVAPIAAAELLSTYKELPMTNKSAYLYVDIGAHITTVSLVSKHNVYASSFFYKGGDDITNDIMNNFRISFDEANRLKHRYGYSNELKSFNPPIYRKNTENGEIVYTISQLRDIIKLNMDEFALDLKTCINTMFKSYDANITRKPIILSGDASRLNGFVEYLRNQLPNQESITLVSTNSIGARNPGFVNALGAIVANAKYRGSYQDEGPRVTRIERENENINKNIPEEGREEL